MKTAGISHFFIFNIMLEQMNMFLCQNLKNCFILQTLVDSKGK